MKPKHVIAIAALIVAAAGASACGDRNEDCETESLAAAVAKPGGGSGGGGAKGGSKGKSGTKTKPKKPAHNNAPAVRSDDDCD